MRIKEYYEYEFGYKGRQWGHSDLPAKWDFSGMRIREFNLEKPKSENPKIPGFSKTFFL